MQMKKPGVTRQGGDSHIPQLQSLARCPKLYLYLPKEKSRPSLPTSSCFCPEDPESLGDSHTASCLHPTAIVILEPELYGTETRCHSP